VALILRPRHDGRKAINLRPIDAHRETEARRFAFFESVADVPRSRIPRDATSLPLLQPAKTVLMEKQGLSFLEDQEIPVQYRHPSRRLI
jgi:hypothetical protein